ncbi:MAG: hypothetical protein D6806_15635 [Deltaproteobacteria bacterium]|nr:MAG: hypothetical protein D6806_15635 [Deltaproteobacteria bacterium]
MLDAYIIEELKKMRKKRERRHEPPRLEITIEDIEPEVRDDERGNRDEKTPGVIIIDYGS